MKWRLLALLFFLPLIVEAASPARKAEVDFSQGLLAFKGRDYEEAERHFSTALEKDRGNVSATYFLGVTRYHLAKYDEAVALLNDAIQKNPREPESFFYRGLSHYRLEKKDEAIEDFKKVTELASAGPMYDLSVSYLRRLQETGFISEVSQERRWFLFGNFGSLSDSNVSLNPEGVTLATLPSDQSDLQFSAEGGGGYRFLSGEKYRLSAKTSYTHSFHLELSEFDYGVADVELEPSFREGRFGAEIPVAYQFSFLGGEKYLSRPLLKPSVQYLFENRFLSRLTLRGRLDSFFQAVTNVAQNRDAKNLEVEVAEYLLGDDQKHFLKLSYIFEENWADGADWDYRAHGVGFSMKSPLFLEMTFYFYGEVFFDKKFHNIDSILGTRRDDFSQVYGIKLTRKIVRSVDFVGSYDFYRNSSNQSFFAYSRQMVGGSFAFSF
ncbi:MAG: tetratricopeptide repeat protein [Deltaproteobacteria bacterium]|nr:tetratricopeptide repeat protein [Deltaproteobacteria bacterium]